MEDSELEFAVFCGVVGEFGLNRALEFAGVVVDVALDGVRSSWMLEEGRDIESAVPQELVLLFELKGESGWLFRHFNKKHLVDGLTRWGWGGAALGNKAKRDIAGDV